jgi:sucrose-6-phosphate hydrolase SacC (GH32 family)
MDFGKDFYAAQTYNNDPLGRAIVVGWMRNWQ